MLLLLVIVIAILGKYKSATGITFIVASIYVYFGVLQLEDNNIVWRFSILILSHFLLCFFAPVVAVNATVSSKRLFVINSLSILSLLIYLVILVVNFDPINLELSRMKTFGSYKPLYYNVLIAWPVLYLLRDRVSRKEIFIYLLVCFLTGFRSLLVNFIYLISIKGVLTQKGISFRRFALLMGTITVGVTALSLFRDGGEGSILIDALVHRIFMVNAENIEYIVALRPDFGFSIILRDFVPLRYLTMVFHDYNLTSAEEITRDLNIAFFNTGRIMTPTMFGLGIAAWGLNGLFLPVILVFFLDYLASLFAYVWVRRIWLVWIFLSISFVTRGVFSVLGLYGTIAAIVLIFSSVKLLNGKRSNN